MKRHLCLWFPAWPVQRLRVAQPALNGRAIVLHSASPRYGHRVAVCSAEAAAAGVCPGMPLADASSLLVHRSRATAGSSSSATASRATNLDEHTLRLAVHDPAADRAALETVADWCSEFSPSIALDEANEPDSLLLEISGCAHLFGGEDELVRRLLAAIESRGYAACAAIADTALAAWAIAHFFCDPSAGGTTSMIVPAGANDRLNGLPVAALRLPPETAGQLQRLGIERIEQLTALPRPSLPVHFGDELTARLDQLFGGRDPLLTAQTSPEPLSATVDFEYPTAHRATIETAIGGLLDRLAEKLVHRDRGAVRLECRLACQGRRTVTVDVGLFRPSADAAYLLELVRMQLELLAVPGMVHRIEIEAIETAPLVQRQLDLFAESGRRSAGELAALVDRLSSRLGRDNVVRMELQADAQPELAFRVTPLTDSRAAGATAGSAALAIVGSSSSAAAKETTLPPAAVCHRPLHLYFPPRPIQVIAVSGGPPVRLHMGGDQQRIVNCWGPERIETGWWRGPSVQRSYFRIETENGQRLWIFRRQQDGHWWLHGAFD